MTIRSKVRNTNLLSKVGNTPLKLLKSYSSARIRIYAKLEWEQFGASVKSRPAAAMMDAELGRQALTAQQRILEATSGNTGIALSQFAQQLNIPITIVIPENASKKRIELLKNAGAEIVFSSALEGTDGAQLLAAQMTEESNRYRYINQYNNPENFRAHYKTTGPEIWKQTGGQVTHFIAGLGTSGTFRGVFSYLKSKNPHIECVALQPDMPLHGLEGWKHMETALNPGIYLPDLPDAFVKISSEVAIDMVRDIYKREKLWVSPSSAGNLVGALTLADNMDSGEIVTVFPDNGTKYSEIFNPIYNK